MKNGWAAGAPEFGKLIVPSVAFWPEAGDATSQQTNPSSNGAPAERRCVSVCAPQPLNRDLTLMLAIRISSTPLPSPPTKPRKHTEPVWSDDDITVTAWLPCASPILDRQSGRLISWASARQDHECLRRYSYSSDRSN